MNIEIKNIKKSFGKIDAIKGITLNIGQGMFGLLGANGAGKTTFMRILTTILTPDSGEILIDGKNINDIPDIKSRIGYLPQEFSFYPKLTVYEVMDYLAIIGGIKDISYRKKLINKLLKMVNLWQHKDIKSRALSGGMKRRLGIAQALLNDPQILVVDEPTAGLDPEERVRFRNMLSDFASDRTVILSTHIVEDIKVTCSKLAVLKKGSLIFHGNIKEMVEMSRGLVWKIKIDDTRMAELQKKYNVLSYRSDDGFIDVRVLSNEKPEENNVVEVTPNIEDSYIALMKGELM